MVTLADAIIEKNLTQVSKLLQFNIDVNQIDEYGFTPLIEAAIVDQFEIAELLIEQGADVNLQDMIGGTALHWAAENNNLRLCHLLLEHRANPNAYNLAGQPVLAMPLLRNQQKIKKILYQYGANLQFAQDFINTKLLGHMFELVGIANILDPKNQFVQIDFEGFYLEFSLGLIGDTLAQFKTHFAARKLRRYSDLIQAIANVINHAAQLAQYQQYQVDINQHQSEIDALLQQQPLILPIGYEGHAITFVKWENILVKCDRREDSRLYDNIMFYRVNRPENFTNEFIRKLLYEKQTSAFINADLPAILDLQPLTELKVEAQISGNCSWANVEACIPTLFFLFLSQSHDTQKNISNYKHSALSFFHQWREWNKDRSLQFCIQSFNQAGPVRKACKAEILAAILFQRCDYRHPADENRIRSILSVLATPQYEYILQNYLKIYCYESVSEEGRNFMKLLEEYGYSTKAKRV